MREFIHVLTVDPGCNSDIPEKFLFWGHGRHVSEFTGASCKYETSCIYGCARTDMSNYSCYLMPSIIKWCEGKKEEEEGKEEKRSN